MFKILFLLFLTVPLMEIYILIQVGSIIGALPTIAVVIITAILGAFLLRAQGLSTLARVQSTFAQGHIPAIELLEGLILGICGALLLTPGFFTDTIGFLCLIPGVRRQIASKILQRVTFNTIGANPFSGGSHDPYSTPFDQSGSPGGKKRRDSDVIEGDFRRDD